MIESKREVVAIKIFKATRRTLSSSELKANNNSQTIAMWKKILSLALVTLFIFLFLNYEWKVREKWLEYSFDYRNPLLEINRNIQVDSILASFEKVSFSNLDKDYLSKTGSAQIPFKEILKNATYYRIPRNKLHHPIAGHFRVIDFACKDEYYRNCILKETNELFCLFDKKIFYKTIELLLEIEKTGGDPKALYIVNGHRHPVYNKEVGGAKQSRHIKGEAVDITVGDLNQDGSADKKDKDLVLLILEETVIRNEGGIGRYPGTQSVHFDVRGYKARWDRY